MNRLSSRMQIVARVRLGHVGFACRGRRLRIVPALLPVKHFPLEELHVLAEDFDGKAVKIDSLAARFVHPMCLFLNLLVFQNDVLLNAHHLLSETLDCDEFIIRLSLLDCEENFENLMVLVLYID